MKLQSNRRNVFPRLRHVMGWTDRGSNPGGGQIFRTCRDRPWGQPSLRCNGYRVLFPGVKRPGRGFDHPTPQYSADVKERVELYLYSPSGPSWRVLGWTLLGLFEKLRTASISFVTSVCRSVRSLETTGLQMDGFLWNLIFGYFPKVVKIPDPLSLSRITGILHEDVCTFMTVSQNEKCFRYKS
jgi:hypothetical protein